MISVARAFILAVLVVVLAAGCSSGDESGRFDDAVGQVRAAVAAGDREAATTALDAVALQALAAHDEGELDGEELAEVAELIESSRLLVDDIVPAPSTTAADAPDTEASDRGNGEGDGDDEDKDDEGDKDDEKKKDDKDDDD